MAIDHFYQKLPLRTVRGVFNRCRKGQRVRWGGVRQRRTWDRGAIMKAMKKGQALAGWTDHGSRVRPPLQRCPRCGPALLLIAAAMALTACTSEKDRLDAEARRLCSIDGGIKVFETVTLPPEKFNQYGQPLIPNGKDDKGYGYFSKGDQEHIAGQISQLSGDGAGLKKHTSQIVRTADGKVMGESIVYGRHGGGLLDGYLHGSGFRCPDVGPWELENKVFMKGETK